MAQSIPNFTPVTPQVSIYHPVPSSTSTQDPVLVILCAWAFANPRHISKYIKTYQILLPHTSILLVQSKIGDMLWVPDGPQHRALQPTVLTIREFLETSKASRGGTERSPQPRVVVHAFSNAGSHSIVQLAEAWARSTPSTAAMKKNLPVDALILDSAPGGFYLGPSVKAIVQGAPNFLILKPVLSIVIWAFLGLMMLLESTGVQEGSIAKLRRVLNEPVFLEQELGQKGAPIPRLYLFSEQDDIVLAKDVVAHAEDARTKLGMAASKDTVRTFKFNGSKHVQHAVADGTKYWGAVADLLASVGVKMLRE